jgi:hypothetical protein
MSNFGVVMSHRPHPGQESASENVYRRVLVSVQDKSTVRAGVRALRERLSHDDTATGAFLTCTCGIHFHNFRPSTFGLVAEDVDEAGPASVGNRTSKRVVLEHVEYVQALHPDQPMRPDQFQSGLMMMFTSEIGDANVDSSDFCGCFAPIFSSSLATADDTLSDAQGRQFTFQVTRILNADTIGRGQEGFKANVNADSRQTVGSNIHVTEITGENDIPLICFALQGCCFNNALDGTMHLGFDHSNVLNTKAVVFQSNPVSIGGEFDAAPMIMSLEPRIARFTFASFDSTEERDERFIEPSHSSLSRGEVEAGKVGVIGTKILELSRLVGVSDAAAMRLIFVSSLFETEVVEPSMRFERDLQFPRLVDVRIEPELVGSTQLFSFLPFNVASDARLGDGTARTSVIATAPQRRQPRTQRRKLGSKIMRSASLEAVDQFRDGTGRIGFKKQVDVIGHNFEGVNRRPNLQGYLVQQSTKSLFNFADKDGTTVFWAPNQMKFQGVNGPGVLGVSLDHKTIITTPGTKSRGKADMLPLPPKGDSPRMEI